LTIIWEWFDQKIADKRTGTRRKSAKKERGLEKRREALKFTIREEKLHPEMMGATVWEHWVQFSCPSFLAEIPVGAFTGGNGVSEEVPRLLIYEKDGKKGYVQVAELPFPEENRFGDVYCMAVEGIDVARHLYAYALGDRLFCDPYARLVYGREGFGDQRHLNRHLLAGFLSEGFDWEGDRPLNRPMSELVIYRMHVRGFTAHPSSGVADRGTFRGVQQKLHYLEELGVTAVEFLPVTEFEEVEHTWMNQRQGDGAGLKKVPDKLPTGRVNYWGYVPSYLFAPKHSYHCENGGAGADVELKTLIKALHQKKIEVILDLYFPDGILDGMMLEAMRFWVLEYHVDGIHISGRRPCQAVAVDAVLARTKLFANDWGMVTKNRGHRLVQHHDGFLVDMRCFLKGDEGSLGRALARIWLNPEKEGIVNYMASTNGFSLADMVAFDQKHNEGNGEQNCDGTDFNYSWNCGVEGKTKRKPILSLRKSQMRNALAMLFLSQGTPLLEMGDEVAHTKEGNNNTFCQDNRLSWMNWRRNKSEEELYQFVRFLIAFRRCHKIFHMEEPFQGTDYQGVGCPDFSVHGQKPWRPEFEPFRRQLGLLYCGDYAGELDKRFYVLYNMHWIGHSFALPPLPKGEVWKMAIHTTKEAPYCYGEGEAFALENQENLEVAPRTVVVLVSGKEPDAMKVINFV